MQSAAYIKGVSIHMLLQTTLKCANLFRHDPPDFYTFAFPVTLFILRHIRRKVWLRLLLLLLLLLRKLEVKIVLVDGRG